MKTKLEMGTKFQLNKNNAKRFLGVNLFYCHEAHMSNIHELSRVVNCC